MKTPLVSSEWLNKHINDPDLIVLDASQQTNVSGTSSAFAHLQIPGARGVDLEEEFSLKSTSLPSMLLAPEQFEIACRNIGINDSSKIVVYDNMGVYTSPRFWWMLKSMGQEDVSILNGGLPDWIAKGFDTESEKATHHKAGNFTSSFNEKAVKHFSEIENNLSKQDCLLVDARSAGRFDGTAPEPREGIISGSIPNSINIPFQEVLENGKFKSKEALVKIFDEAKVDDRPLIFSCGSGITACILLVASEIIGREDTSIYDGSWMEWAERTQNN